MASLHVTLKSGRSVQTVRTHSRQLIVGRGAGANLRVPLDWLAERQVEIRHESGVLRVRALPGSAKVFALGQQVEEEWVVLPQECQVEVRYQGASLVLALRAGESRGMALLTHDNAENGTPSYAGAIIAGPDGHAEMEQPLELPPPIELQEPSIRSRRGVHLTIGALALLVVMAALALLGYDTYRSNRQRAAELQAYDRFQATVDKALSQISSRSYPEARASLKEAEGIAQGYKWEERIGQVQQIMRRPEIQYGANGYVKMHGKWVEPATAAAWREAELKYDEQIAVLTSQAQEQSRQLKYADARGSCAEAMVLMNHFPEQAKPHPRLDQVRAIDTDAHNKLVADEMTAKGMVLYAGRWMTAQEQFDLQQAEKGLVKYKDKWLTKDQAFAAEQTDKGLVLHEGKWMTPEQMKTAQGYVLFETAWVTPQRRQEIIAAREQQRQAELQEEAIHRNRLT